VVQRAELLADTATELSEGLGSVPRYRVYRVTMRSTQLAAEVGVTVETLRYDGRRGLLNANERDDHE
jgi:hypothetical protein